MRLTRLCATVFVKDGFIVRSEQFTTHQIFGNGINTIQRFFDWEVDELLILDISRTSKFDTRRDDHKIQSFNSMSSLVNKITQKCHLPLAVGGNICTLQDARDRFAWGADKIVINSMFYQYPEQCVEISKLYGNQSILFSLDYRNINGILAPFYNRGTQQANYSVNQILDKCEKLGIGEIMLHNIDHDGSGCGFDTQTIEKIVSKTSIPILACGGCGHPKHVAQCLEIPDLSGVCIGNILHYSENAYNKLKTYCNKNVTLVRPNFTNGG